MQGVGECDPRVDEDVLIQRCGECGSDGILRIEHERSDFIEVVAVLLRECDPHAGDQAIGRQRYAPVPVQEARYLHPSRVQPLLLHVADLGSGIEHDQGAWERCREALRGDRSADGGLPCYKAAPDGLYIVRKRLREDGLSCAEYLVEGHHGAELGESVVPLEPVELFH